MATAGQAFAVAHTTVNGGVALVAARDALRVTLGCSNCSDKTYITSFLAGLELPA